MPIKTQARKIYDSSALVRVLLKPAVLARRKWLTRNAAVTREIFCRLADALVEDPVVQVPGFPGTYVLGPRSDMFRNIIMTGGYEGGESQICRDLVPPHRDAIDIGSNVGLYAVLLSTLLPNRRVLAIEPTPVAAKRLRINLARNNATGNTTVFEGVASDVRGQASLGVVPGKEEYSSLGEITHEAVSGEYHERIRVESSTVDELVADEGMDPGFVKIDVEGMEHRVLGGMQRVLEHHRPIILTEISDHLLRANGSSAAAVVRLIKTHSYRVQEVSGREVREGSGLVGELICTPE